MAAGVLMGLRRRFVALCAGLVVAALSPSMPPALAQVPSAEQLELLRSLSPEDRAALMQQLGLGGDGGDTGAAQKRPGEAPSGAAPALSRADLERLDNRLRAEDTVLVDIDFIKAKPARIEQQGAGQPPIQIAGEPAPTYEPEERRELGRLIDLVRARNPYQLDRAGSLQLPGFAAIPLAGLTDEQATRRVAAEPALLKLDVRLTRLPVKKQGTAALKPYGYDLFTESPSTFAPLTDVPVPSDYIVGPGDELMVQLYGSQNRSFRLTVGRDGRVSFPELGPIGVGGKTFNAVRADLESRVSRQMIGVRASVSMGETRSIRVFVLGEAIRPGSYTISGLGTVTTALFASGGIKETGSLRDIQLKRQGATIRRIDLYDLLLRGDSSNDAKLLPGDVIFIPPVGPTVAVEGEVKRPAIYELRGAAQVADVVALAGGLTPEADNGRVAMVRVDENRRRVVLDVPLDTAEGRSERLRNGDSLRVLRLRPTLDSGVGVEGHVFRPGMVAWRQGLRLSEVIGSVDELKPGADTSYILVRRELPPDRRLAVVSADLGAALRAPGSRADIVLEPRDRIIVFEAESSRRQVVDPLLDELRRQARPDSPTELVSIGGRVRAPGDYPLEPGMRVSDLVRAGGNLEDAAFGGRAELTRYRTNGSGRETELVEIDLAAVLRGDAAADVTLRPFDYLNIKETPDWAEQERVTLAGEVRFPGTYPIRRGETLKSVLERAGGFTSLAFPDGSVFTRRELQQREQEQIDKLAERLQGDLAAAALQGSQANQAQAGQALAVGQALLAQLKDTRAVGRLVIDLDRVIAARPRGEGDIVLRDGDQLVIPKVKQEVTVLGEVQNTTSHLYRGNLTRDDYIALSGGLTRKADKGRIYVVRADGSVIASESRGWFRRGSQVEIRPGDTIVAPLDTERLPPLPLWQAVTQIVYNLAIAAAAINSF
jgi:protein involved in polysaccharide export with SLBB domain